MGKILSLSRVREFVGHCVGDMHTKRVKSIANAVFGALHDPYLRSSTIGRAYARGCGKTPKHGVKQVDRLLDNTAISLGDVFGAYVPQLIGPRKQIVVSLDWTDFDGTNQSRIALNLVTRHGRATPLLWITVWKDSLRKRRTAYEKKALRQLHKRVPAGVRVTILADRGFCNTELLAFLTEQLHWDYVVRLRGNIELYAEATTYQGCHFSAIGVKRGASAILLRDARITAKKYPVATTIGVWDKAMKEPWYLVSSRRDDSSALVKLYGRRFTCEEQFRDEKDDRFGAGAKQTSVSTLHRRDMLTFIHAIATVLLTFVGEAGERIGYDRKLKANTTKRRTHSLYRQGREYLAGIAANYVDILRETLHAIMIERRRRTAVVGVV